MVVIAICAFYLLSMLTSMICRKNIYKHQRFFGYKYVDWAKEREVRLISYNTTSDSPFFGEKLDDNSKIEEIVFGFRCPQETKEVICSLIKNYDYHIQLSEMVQDKDNVYCLRKESYKQ